MKTGFYLCCVGIALAVVVEVSAEQKSDSVDQRGLYLESAQSQNAAAETGKQSSSYLNVDGGYPVPNYVGSGQPQYLAPTGWSNGGNLQVGQQSSESALAKASSNQYSKLISDGEYPQYLPSGLAPLERQAPSSGPAQYSQPEPVSIPQSGASSSIEQVNYPNFPAQPPQYPQEYYGSPINYVNGISAPSSSLAASAASISGGLPGISSFGSSDVAPSGISEATASQSYQPQGSRFVPKLKCGYVRQCQTVFEPAY